MRGTPAWEQPERPAVWAGPWRAVRQAMPGLLVAGVPLSMIMGMPLPVPVAVGLAGAGIFVFLRRLRSDGGPWVGFVAPPGLTYRASDPEFGATLGGALTFPGHTFENILTGRSGAWEWTYVEVVQGQVKRDELLVIDLGTDLPPTRAVRRIVTGTDELGRAITDALLPAPLVGRTGFYGFPPGANPDSAFLTSLVTPGMTAALETGVLQEWAILGRHLVATPAPFLARAWAITALTDQAATLAAIADAIRDATGIVPPPTQPRWPTLG